MLVRGGGGKSCDLGNRLAGDAEGWERSDQYLLATITPTLDLEFLPHGRENEGLNSADESSSA